MSEDLRIYTNGSYRWRLGWHPASLLTTDYEIIRWPKPGGQHRGWIIPVADSSIIDDHSDLRVALGGRAYPIGQGSFSWTLSHLTAPMVYHLAYDTTTFNGAKSARATVMTWDRLGLWRVYWVLAYLRKASEAGGDRVYGRGYGTYRINFAIRQDAPGGCDLAVSLAINTVFEAGSPGSHTVTATNGGDHATTGDIVLTMNLPSELVYQAVSNTSGWTVEYYESGAWVSSVTDPADVTALRLTAQSALEAGESFPAVVVQTQADIAGTYALSASVTTEGDTDDSNNSDSLDTVVSAP